MDYCIISVIFFLIGYAVGDFVKEARLRIRLRRWFLGRGYTPESVEEILEEVCHE